MSVEGLKDQSISQVMGFNITRKKESINQFLRIGLCQNKYKAIEITIKINQSIKNGFAANLDLNGRREVGGDKAVLRCRQIPDLPLILCLVLL